MASISSPNLSIPTPTTTTTPSPAHNVLLAVTGSVAAVKGPELAVRIALETNANVKVLLSRGGQHFWNKAPAYNQKYWGQLQSILQQENPKVSVIGPEDEWREWNELGDPVLHIDLRDWADVMVIAPLSAHTLAKIASGLCDDTLSCVVRAWDFGYGARRGKPLVLAPAMNTAMWDHPITQRQLESIRGFWNEHANAENGVIVVSPQVKELACGEVGQGALAATNEILSSLRACFK